jgi:diacylglycerol kinase (ATP)
MRRVAVILNPRADRGRNALKAAALRQATTHGIELTLLETHRRGHAVELARDAAADGFEAVIAMGGDGTVHEVANGLMNSPVDERPALGIIPAGSGNDVAYALGLTADLTQAVQRIERCFTRPVDVGVITTETGDARHFLNNVGALLEGEVNLASHQYTWPRGPGLYLRAVAATLLRRPQVHRLRLVIDGMPLDREAILLSIANGPRSGGRFQLSPDARIDDGHFDYLLAAPMHRLQLVWQIFKALRGVHALHPAIERGHFTEMTIHSDAALSVHVDGEPWLPPEAGVRSLTLKLQPQALRVLCDEP